MMNLYSQFTFAADCHCPRSRRKIDEVSDMSVLFGSPLRALYHCAMLAYYSTQF